MSNDSETRRADEFGDQQRDGLRMGGESPFETGPGSHATTDDLRRIRALVASGRAWVRANPDSWAAGEAYSLRWAAKGLPVEWHDVAHAMLDKSFTNVEEGRDTTLDNTIGPLLMRWLVVLHPELKPFVHPRRSMFDLVEIGGPYGA